MCKMRKDMSLDVCSGTFYIHVEGDVIQSLEKLLGDFKRSHRKTQRQLLQWTAKRYKQVNCP